ncbi:hypothetical protein JIN85_03330 [Luteolibacter pohnpeiensis]|uniref:PEP-CTERM protein-sorting domain-containing protein n=1 Tax=Luteolibacter pohnpeiensis TaxID=454153 RepID=A0A934S328_9BACT|nr:hypothetical protein [Luteolibacter pohnpeiensis]
MSPHPHLARRAFCSSSSIPFISRSLAAISLGVLCQGAFLTACLGDEIQWADEHGEVGKNFDDSTVSYQVATDRNLVTFQFAHQGASSGMFSISQWAVSDWPEKDGAVANGENDIALSMWGYYGEDGAGEETLATDGDYDIYALTISFNTAVENLTFDINSINALIKDSGFNSQDILTIQGTLNGEYVSLPSLTPLDPDDQAYVIAGDTLTGDFNHELVYNAPDPGQHVTDSGSVHVTFETRVDTIEVVMKNVATRPDAENFQSGYVGANGETVQYWGFSVGDLTFTTIPEPTGWWLGCLAGCGWMLRRRRS